MNKAKSEVPGPTFKMTITPKGEYVVSNGTLNYSYFCDGKDYAVVGQRTIACLQTSATKMDVISKDNGKQIDTAHKELSADGKTLTLTIISSVGTKEVKKTVYARMSASVGFAGAWKNTNDDPGPQLMVTNLTSATLHVAYPTSKQYADLNLDGTDAPVHGITFPPGTTLSATLQGSHQILTTKKVNGAVVNQGVLTLSADGRTLIEEWWRPAYPSVKGHRVYEKQ